MQTTSVVTALGAAGLAVGLALQGNLIFLTRRSPGKNAIMYRACDRSPIVHMAPLDLGLDWQPDESGIRAEFEPFRDGPVAEQAVDRKISGKHAWFVFVQYQWLPRSLLSHDTD